MTNKKKRKRARRRKQILIIGISTIGLLAAALLFLLLLPSATSEEKTETFITAIFETKPTVPKDTTVSGVSFGGLTEEKAREKLLSMAANFREKDSLHIGYGPYDLFITPLEAEVRWNIEEALEQAMCGISTELHVQFNRDYVRDAIISMLEPAGGIYVPSGYWIEGLRPALDDAKPEFQTLVLNTGSSGLMVDLDRIMELVEERFQTQLNDIYIPFPEEYREVAPLDVENVFSQVSITPVNPNIDRKSLEIIPGVRGYGFDVESVKQMVEKAENGSQLRITMQFLEPEVTMDDVWFLDTLGSCSTPITDNENRNHNLRLACSKLNGLILQPGEVLSYNELLGKRTTAAGYKPAPAYVGTELTDDIGGGICQVSSTLYLSSLFAELKIIDRRNHGYPVSYIPLGLDATVNWGTTDLKIRNDYELPVKIRAEVADGDVSIQILGVEQRDYYVKMEYRVDDHPEYAAAFRCRYDRETDEQIYRKLDHTSIYLDEVWCNPGFAQCN